MDVQSGKNKEINQRGFDHTMNNKQIHVTFISQKLKELFERLKDGKFEDKQLYKFINRAMDDLKQNPPVASKFLRNYGQENMFKNIT